VDRSAEVEAFVEAVYAAWASGDADTIASQLHDDVLLIGTDPREWWHGKAEVTRAFAEQAEALGGAGLPVEPGETTAHAAGDVGWFAGHLTFVIDDQPVHCRHTGVVVRDGSSWLLASSHLSIGIANEWAVGSDLPR
jgi:ketosteroid isomerase-like protein